MNPDDANITEATRRLIDRFDPAKIMLFGSRATGTAGEESDVDFIVLCNSVADRHDPEAKRYASRRGIPVPIDLMVSTPEEFEKERTWSGTVARPAARDGQVAYERAA